MSGDRYRDGQIEPSQVMPGGAIFQSGDQLNPYMFRKGWACWLCKGMKEIPCKECAGTGIKDGLSKYSTD